MKFLVIWKIELSLLSSHVASAVARMPAYARPLERSGRIAARYHIVGARPASGPAAVTGRGPERHVSRLERVVHGGQQLALDGVEVHGLPQP